jgi:hypothetical protein
MKKFEKQKLSLDLDALFPGESVQIGNSIVIIRPLSIAQIALISKKLKTMGSILAKEGVTWENFSEKTSIFKIAVTLLESFPEVLEEASNIEVEDLKQLPLDYVILILTKIIEVNLKSKETLTKNFKSLTEQLLVEMEGVPVLN